MLEHVGEVCVEVGNVVVGCVEVGSVGVGCVGVKRVV